MDILNSYNFTKFIVYYNISVNVIGQMAFLLLTILLYEKFKKNFLILFIISSACILFSTPVFSNLMLRFVAGRIRDILIILMYLSYALGSTLLRVSYN